MSIERLLTTVQSTEWETILPAHRSVFGSVEYARIVQEHKGFQARLFVYETANTQIAYPFFMRPVSALPFAQALAGEWWDTLSPEYTGPLRIDNSTCAVNLNFPDHFAAFCRANDIVTEFAHLHPWHWHSNLLKTELVSLDREIVYVDLTLSNEQLWNDSFTHACRKNINRSKRENVLVFPATTPEHIRKFHRIYSHTMNRNDASDKYLFSVDYFMAFFETMSDNACFMLAEYDDQVIAGTLYLHDATDVYSYLGGADQEFQHIRPSNAIVYETIQWARDAGKQRLVLGGGYQPNDGIFRFKSSFSPLRANFRIYKRIHLNDVFLSLRDKWAAYYDQRMKPGTFFPAYREMPPSMDVTLDLK